MSGIYLHIPFCKTRCVYCDFYKETDESKIDEFVTCVCKELSLRKQELGEPVKTIYFGGGTPSRLGESHFNRIFETLYSDFTIDNDVEITLEANPDDLSISNIQMLKKLPFNRLSIGIQSFEDHELKFLSRRHSSLQAIEAVRNSQQAGFDNISIDLMYGLPKQTLHIWEKNLMKACDLNIQHISAYHLIYEMQTKLYTLLKRGKIQPVGDETSTTMFLMLIDLLEARGFEHYEISNFAKDKKYSKHNTSYWQNKNYLGVGPSAHSYDGKKRSWNISSLDKYIHSIESGNLLQEYETLTLPKYYNEFILTGLRTKWGVDLKQLEIKFGEKQKNYCIRNSQKFLDKGLLVIENEILKLTRDGIFISDGIMSELMWID